MLAELREKTRERRKEADCHRDEPCGLGHPSFYDNAYRERSLKTRYEWYCTAKDLKSEIIHSLMAREAKSASEEKEHQSGTGKLRALELGCGDSCAAEEIFGLGLFEYVLAVDLAEDVIKLLSSKASEHSKDKKCDRENRHDNGSGPMALEGLEYKVLDVTTLKGVEDNSFHFALDKATADSVSCGPLGKNGVRNMIASAGRVLVHGGIYLMLTVHKEFAELFSSEDWEQPISLELKKSASGILGKQMSQYCSIRARRRRVGC
mmetsp:Transcript_20132/g.49359  ORF Transcript_20132/g.49359 Transcript_20132/m.49359 type:complete len:263 (-) Transcript_20132:66-854(-)